MSFLEITSLKKVYTTRNGANEVTAVKNVSFTVEKSEYVAVMGGIGFGKNNAAKYPGGARQTDRRQRTAERRGHYKAAR